MSEELIFLVAVFAAGTLTVSLEQFILSIIVFFLSINTAVAVCPQMSAEFVLREKAKNPLMEPNDAVL